VKLDDLTREPATWLRKAGPDSDVVISSQIQLIRNLAGYSFCGRATDLDLESVKKTVRQATEELFPVEETTWFDVADFGEEDFQILRERHLINQDFVDSRNPRALFLKNNEEFSVSVNAVDHLLFQEMSGGFALDELWNAVNVIDDTFESALVYAFDEKYGYLSANLSDVGTGLHASVVLHLPALMETKEISKTFESLKQLNCAMSIVCGTCSLPVDRIKRLSGDFFQVSTRRTLGLSEERIIELFSCIIRGVVNYERKARQTVMERNKEGLLDRCSRSLGLLQTARMTSMEEASRLLSSLRLGAEMGILDESTRTIIDEALVGVQPAHIVRIVDANALDLEEEATFRAQYLRSKFENVALPQG